MALIKPRANQSFGHKLTNSANDLTRIYIIALSLVALLSVGGFTVVQSVTKAGQHGAVLINVGGRQRRLSQQVALYTLEAATAANKAERSQAKKDLAAVLDLLERTHYRLSTGSEPASGVGQIPDGADLPKGLSASVQKIYFGPTANLDKQMQDFFVHAHSVLNSPESALNRANPDVQYILREGPGQLLTTITMLVKQYEVDSQKEIEDINTVEAVFLGLTLLLLTCEALFIFRPMSRRINRQMTELLDSQRELSAVFDTVGEALLTMNADNSVITANDRVQAIWGTEKSEVVGKKLDEFIKLEPQNVSLTAGEHLGRRLEVSGVRQNGKSFPLEITITKTNLSDRTLFTASARDLTERKALENQMSQFYSTVSHELRTPLTSIRGALSVMDGGLTGELPAKAKVFVRMACDESDRLVRLINDFLDLRKIAAGMIALRIQAVDLTELIDRALNNLKSIADEKGIILLREGENSAPLRCDPDRTVQVLTNLVSNAIKFSPHEAQVRIVLNKTDDGKAYRVEIRDCGPGIAPEHMNRLFGMFQQVDSSDTRPAGGTGLGLAISKAIVNQHGGQIGVLSAVNNGSTFWFDLPIEPAPQPPPVKALNSTDQLLSVDEE